MTHKVTTKLFALLLLLICAGWTTARAQNFEVRGTVTDQADGSPLPGVNILIKGTSRGTSTNVDGQYSLQVRSPQDTLVFSYIGYQSQEVPVNGRNTIDVQLQTQTLTGQELVVVGYGTQSRRDVTGSISSVNGEDINQIPSPSVTDALQGQVAGVQVTPNSGKPGAGSSIRIRGVGTLNDSSPLYVVDGMLLDDISFLNMDEVKSVQVLKDASATAIYGSRGANGVVIITTNEGRKNQPAQFSLNAYYGWQQVANKIDLVNARQYATLANELAQNEGQQPLFDNPDQFGAGTDWQDVIFRTSPIQSYELSTSGGTDKVTYHISGNYIGQDGIIRKSDYQRASLRVNNTYYLSDFVTLGHNIAVNYRTSNNEPGGIVDAAYHADPTVSPYTDSGDFSNASARASSGNPAATLYYTRNDISGGRLVGNVYAQFDFLKHFSLKSSFGTDIDRSETKTFNPVYYVSATQQNDQSKLSVNTTSSTNWLWENTLKYQNDIGDHSIKVLTGVTAQEYRQEGLGGSRVNMLGSGEELWYLDAGGSDGQSNYNNAFSWSMLSYLFRTNYSYKGRYLLTATMRADGSSRFGSNNRFGYFPSFALGWRISDEPFMQDFDFINELKLRASWGKIGNDKISAYPGRPVVTSGLNAVFGTGEQLYNGATLVDLANPDIQWEETEQTDVGLELGLFRNRLSANVDYYNRKTDKILVQVPIPDYIGARSEPYVNAASVVNRGFDFNVKWSESREFSYSIGLVASTVHNEVKSLGRGKEEILGGGLVNEIAYTTRTVPGQPIGGFYGYKVVGVFQNQQQIDNSPSRGVEVPGDLQYKDVNGDGVITPDDRTYLGSPIPDLIYGINLSFGYKGFDMKANFSGQRGNKIFNAKKNVRFGMDNFETSYLDRWHGEGTSNSEPRLTNAGHNYLASDRFIEDGSYFKLRNMQIGYTLPHELTRQLNVRNLRVYVNGTNLFTLTDYSGYTPEIPAQSVIANGIDNGVYPLARTYSIGVNVDF